MTPDQLERLKSLASDLWQRHGRETPVEGLLLTSIATELGPVHTVYRPSLCVVLQGAKTSAFGDSAHRYEAGKCLIASMSVPIKAHIHGATTEMPYMAFSLQIDPAVVADLLLAAQMEQGASQPVAALAVHALPEELFDPLERLLLLCDRSRDRNVLAPLIQREIIWLLLHSPMAPALRQIALADSRMSRIGRAISDIRRNYAAPLSIPMLSRVAGMSPATFHRHFKAVTAMTPVQYQKMLRLQEARRLLLAEGGDIARIGFAIGYESPSQFSREYRRIFGVPPARDGKRIRSGLVAQTDP